MIYAKFYRQNLNTFSATFGDSKSESSNFLAFWMYDAAWGLWGLEKAGTILANFYLGLPLKSWFIHRAYRNIGLTENGISSTCQSQFQVRIVLGEWRSSVVAAEGILGQPITVLLTNAHLFPFAANRSVVSNGCKLAQRKVTLSCAITWHPAETLLPTPHNKPTYSDLLTFLDFFCFAAFGFVRKFAHSDWQ